MPQEQTEKVDRLTRFASSVTESLNPGIFVGCLFKPSIEVEEDREINMANPQPERVSQIIKYMKNGEFPEDKEDERKVKIWSSRYLFFSDILYKRSFTLPLLRCLSEEEVDYVL